MSDDGESECEDALDVAVLREWMRTMQAEYRTDIARLAERNGAEMARIGQQVADFRTDMAKRDAEQAKREVRLVVTMVVVVGVAVAAATAVLGTMIAVLD